MTYCSSGAISTPSSSVSSEMPRQVESRLVHLVTQWSALTMSSWGRCVSADQVQVLRVAPPEVIENVHVDRSARGVGPADSTGKPRSRYWPGGMRGSASRLPRNPRETIAIRTPCGRAWSLPGVGDAEAHHG